MMHAKSPSGFTLSILGRFELTGPAGPVKLPSKKACLLAYLAFYSPRLLLRERLAELLWGSSVDEHAQLSLRQSLFRVRKVLGSGAIVGEGTSVGLTADAVSCDVNQFEQLIAAGTHQALRMAVDLYRGPLLDDGNVSEETWGAWVARERDRLQDAAVGALVALGTFERTAGRRDLALQAGQRAVALNALREDGHRLVIAELAASGRKAEALKHYQGLVGLLQRELDAEPDADTIALVADLRIGANGTRQMVKGLAGASDSRFLAAQKAVPAKGLDVSHPRPGQEPPLSSQNLSLIVLPFQYLGDDDRYGYLVDAMTEAVTADLSRISALTVIASTTAGAFNTAAADIKQVCRDAGARFVLSGSLQSSGRALRISAQFFDGSTGAMLWSDRFDGDRHDTLLLQDQITGRIAVSIGRKIDVVAAADSERMSSVPGAMDLLYRGIAAAHQPQSRDSLAKQEHYFREAIRLDPMSSEAYARLARAVALQLANQYDVSSDADRASRFAEARDAASRAVALNPNNPHAHIAMGVIHMQQGEFAQAVIDNEIAIALNRNIPRPHHNLGNALVLLGQAERAIPAIERAMRLDPFGPNVATNHAAIGYANLQLGNIDEAYLSFLKARATNRVLPRAFTGLAVALVLKGDIDEARRVAAELVKALPAYRLSKSIDRVYPTSSAAYKAFHEKTVAPAAAMAGIPM